MRSLSVLLAPVALAAVLATPASSGNGIQMRHLSGVCVPVCMGDRDPVWSPDGKSIAFIRRTRTEAPRTIFTVPAAGGPVRRVTRPSRAFIPDSIAWSPDGTRLAFHAMEGVNYVVPARGGSPVKLVPPSTTGPSFWDYAARWSPEGTRVAIMRQAPFSRYGPPPWCCQVWISAADGSGATLFGGGPAPADWLAEPAWSPDGRIAYITGPRTAQGNADFSRGEIWVSNVDGSARRRLVSATPGQTTLRQLRWSADGSRLGYVVESSSAWRVSWVSADGSTSRDFAELARDLYFVRSCCWFAADAANVVHTRRGADGGMEVRRVGEMENDETIADGISAQSRFWLTTASWSPDGKQVAYISDGECPTELAVHTVELESKRVRRLTRPCRIMGTSAPNRLRGTRGTDALYGRGGNDRLQALGRHDFLQGGPGRDVLLGGPGDDRLYGGPGRDRILGGAGWDAHYSRDGVADVVRCGTGRDAVRADRHDRVARDCELVERE